ncbi:MAG TPA: amidohydrolase family protein, partial [Candidatus Hydrogenedentes bacterium]|nr:amidohydrolase family protein [Candidatus Hydrogenedentota bacterium]
GFYRVVLRDFANIEYAQVNCIEGPIFGETAQPDLLAQDLSFAALSAAGDRDRLAAEAGVTLKGLKDWHAVIDWAFETYGPRAIAVKSQNAYARGLDYARVAAEEAAPYFEKMLRDRGALEAAERKAVEDHLFHYCVHKATEYDLPVKLHTGYYAGHNSIPLGRLQGNPAEMCELCRAHPDARFVFMHITYPYHDHIIAAAKHWPNAYIDMCWAWIINPMACVRFVKEFLGAAPACKLLTFGGDYRPVEMVPGHAAVARRGLAQALSELVEERWLREAELEALTDCLMRGNAHELFDLERTLKNWNKVQ